MYVQPQKPEGAANVFVLGLLGLLVCGILGIFAWTMGNDYVKRCQAMGVEPDGLGVAGRIMGMIASIMMIVGVCFVVLYFLFFFVVMIGAAAGGAGGM